MALGCRVCPDSPLLALVLQQALLSVLQANDPNSSAGRLLVSAEANAPTSVSTPAPLKFAKDDLTTPTPLKFAKEDLTTPTPLKFAKGNAPLEEDLTTQTPSKFAKENPRQEGVTTPTPLKFAEDDARQEDPTTLRSSQLSKGGPPHWTASHFLKRIAVQDNNTLHDDTHVDSNTPQDDAQLDSPTASKLPEANTWMQAYIPSAVWHEHLPAQVAARRLASDEEAGIIGAVLWLLGLVGLVVLFVCRDRLVRYCGCLSSDKGDPTTAKGYLRGRPTSSKGRGGGRLPWYWANTAFSNADFAQVVYVSREKRRLFQSLLSSTYEGKATQDRYCPEAECQGKKTPGGCEHVKRGAKWLPTGYEPRQVLRVENAKRFLDYLKNRDKLKTRLEDLPEEDLITPKPKTSEIVDCNANGPENDRLFEPLKEELNEVYLFHGTTVRKALAIAKGNFDLQRAGETAGTTMLGDGIYFSESSTKADEYSRDEPGDGDYYHGVYAILLCRVCLGRCYKAAQADPEAMNQQVLKKGARYQSILGDRKAAAGTFREFVVGVKEQVYPEYIIVYTRAGGAFHTPASVSTPFRTQVPVYWSNFHRNPHEEPGFDNHEDRTGRDTHVVLESFANATHTGGDWLKLQSARRIEVAAFWLAYVDCRKRVLESGKGGIECPGKPVLTWEKQPKSVAHELSFCHLDERLNERWLWHGTTKDAAEQIVFVGFLEGSDVGVAHGTRFGAGVYFAEDLRCSLAYAPEDENENRHVFLCRVACGDFVPVTDGSRNPSGVNCLLASPPGNCRQFVVTAAQVYPEYYLKLRRSYDGL